MYSAAITHPVSKTDMKKIGYLFFMLVAAGAATAYGQTAPGITNLPKWKLQMTSPPSLTISGFSINDTARTLSVAAEPPMHRLMPDHMPCLVPDMLRVERMPVKWSRNADPMPNKSHPAPMFVLPPGNR